jgi:hypothetical protein
MKVRKRVKRIRFMIIRWTILGFCMGGLSVLHLIGFWFFVVGFWW